MAANFLPYNNAGLVDPFANAMAGGMQQMYAIQDEQAKGRDSDLGYLMNYNKYGNELADNPLKQAERTNKLSAQGILSDQFANGDMRTLADSATQTQLEEEKGKRAKSRTGPQLEEAAQNTAMFVQDMNALEKSGAGDLAKQQYWDENVSPYLKKTGTKSTNYDPEKLTRMNEFLQNRIQQNQKMQLLQQTGANQLGVATVRGNSSIEAARERARAQQENQRNNPNSIVAEYLRDHPEAVPGYVAGKTNKDDASTITAVSQNLEVKTATIEVVGAQQVFDAALEDGDPKVIEKAAATLNRAKEKRDEAIKKALSMAPKTPSGVTPPASASPPPSAAPSTGNVIDGKKYKPAPAGYHLGKHPNTGQVVYIKD